MAKKMTASKQPTTRKPTTRKAPAKKPRASARSTTVVAVLPSIKIAKITTNPNGDFPAGVLSDDDLLDMTAGGMVASGLCFGLPPTVNVSGQLVGLDVPFTINGAVTYNMARTRWTMTFPDRPPSQGSGDYVVALQVTFPLPPPLTSPVDNAEFTAIL